MASTSEPNPFAKLGLCWIHGVLYVGGTYALSTTSKSRMRKERKAVRGQAPLFIVYGELISFDSYPGFVELADRFEPAYVVLPY